ncbi:MAG: hypothetical protein HY911_13350 [Desulfobacterales bacterium]|nr:hypothetical protein [Desulfobacterales bacterium]
MNGLLIWIVLGVVMYMLFWRKGGMGCCGGHHDHIPGGPTHDDATTRNNPSVQPEDNIIDLKKEDYKVISLDDHQGHHGNL